jgi:hypothetical protein
MTKKQSNGANRTHVVKRESGWAVKKEGAQKATKIYKTKEQAVKGTKKDRASGRDIVIHKKDGSIEKWLKS